METKGRKLLRFLPPALALAGLCAACAYGVRQIENRMQGYGDRRVVINEICAHNLSGLQDGNGAYGDWIELFNPGSEPVDLSGWTLSDDEDDPGRWTFPEGTVLEDYLIVFADRANTTDPAGYCHTSFALRTDGETLYLYDAAGERVDKLKYPEQDFDITYGRAFGSGEDAGTFATATPGAANPVDFLEEEREAPLGTAEFSLPAGFYEEPVEVALRAEDPEALIFYTTDGSDPRENGKLYTGPIEIESRVEEPNEYASLPVSFGFNFFQTREWLANYAYRYAPDPVDKAITITTRLYKDGCWSDQQLASTYWVGVSPYELPVVSITADAQELFGTGGIYMPGAAYFTAIQSGKVGVTGNFLSGKAIDANVQILDGNNTQSMSAEVSVGGNFTRSMSQLKNLSVDIQEETGVDILAAGKESDDLTELSLKGPGNGIWPQFYLDGFWNNYLYDHGLGAQYNVPAVLFLQDEYWGVYMIRERKNEDFIVRHFDVDKDALEVYTIADRREDVTALGETILALPMGEEGWQWLTDHFDMEEYIRYLIAHLYANNFDGIRGIGNNMILWRAFSGDSETYTDGKWRFIFMDFDTTMMLGPNDPLDSIEDLLSLDPATNNIQLLLFQKAWNYAEFRTLFAKLMKEEMEGAYAPENIVPAFQLWCENLASERARNISRQKVERTMWAPLADYLLWQKVEAISTTEDQWQEDYKTLCGYFSTRAEDMLEYLAIHVPSGDE